MPRLSIRTFPENPAKLPDSIGAENGMEMVKRAHYGLFKTVFCAPKKTAKGKWGLIGKNPRQTATGCLKRYFNLLKFWLFLKTERIMKIFRNSPR
jgi:hypothetical protein